MVNPTAGDDNFVIDFGGPQGTPPFGPSSPGSGLYSLDIGSNDASFFNDSLTYTIVTEPTIGSIFGSFGSVFNYLQGAGAGLDTFVYQVSDTDGNTATATVSITVFSTPVANADYVTATPGVPVTIDVKANDTDADGQTLSLVPDSFSSIETGTANFIITNDDQITYTPNTDSIGDASFTYQITDGSRLSTATVFVTLAPDIPSNFTTTERIEVGASVLSELKGAQVPINLNGTSGFVDPVAGVIYGATYYPESSDTKDIFLVELVKGKTYRFDLEGQDTNAGTLADPFLTLFTEPPGGVSLGASIPSFTTGTTHIPERHTPDAANISDDQGGIGANASITHTATTTGTYYIAADSASAGQGTYKLTLTLLNDNNAPVANDDTATVRVGDVVRINIGLNDTDPDGDTLITNLTSPPLQGSIVLTENSNFYDFFTYTSRPNSQFEFTGSDSFTYQVSDGNGGLDTATVTVTINDADSPAPEVTEPEVTGPEVYRFFSTQSGTHFYSRDEFEANFILANLPHYRLEGPAFKAADPMNGPTEDVFRFFNTQSGTHLFTQDTRERDFIIANMDHFNFEGVAYQGHPFPVEGSLPLYRFFNTQTGGHFYTLNEDEKDHIITTASDVYDFENTAYHVYRPTPIELAPVQSDPITIVGTTLALEADFGLF